MNNLVASLKSKGFFHIITSSVINKLIQFSSGVFLVRVLSKSDYGLLMYAQNILMFFLLFNGLGVNAGMLQFGSESDDQRLKNSYMSYGLRVGLSFNTVLAFLLLLFSQFLPLKIEEARTLLSIMFLMPMFVFMIETLQITFRINLENKKFSYINTINAALILIFSLMGGYYYSTKGVIYFRYIAYSLTLIIGASWILKMPSRYGSNNKLSKKQKKDFMSFSMISTVNNVVSQLLYIIDIFLIGIIIVNENVIASYKTATLIPFALNFIPISVMTFIYPYFAQNNKNYEWIRKNTYRLLKYLLVLNLIITILLFVFSPVIIKFLFGEDYIDAIHPFRVLAIGYFFASSFRIPFGNIIGMMKKVKFGLYLSIVTGVFNVILDIFLITSFGSVGAAYATLSVFIFTSIVSGLYLNSILKAR